MGEEVDPKPTGEKMHFFLVMFAGAIGNSHDSVGATLLKDGPPWTQPGQLYKNLLLMLGDDHGQPIKC